MSKVQRFESTLLEVKQITPTVKHYTFSTPKEFTFQAGQYAMLILQIDEKNKVRRPYSIASPPLEKGKISLCVKKVEGGKGTCYMDNLKEGDRVNVMAPMGHFFLKENAKEQDIVFVSTGTGIAPFRSMIPMLLAEDHFKTITLIAGYRHEEERLYHDEFTGLDKQYENFYYHATISQPMQPDYTGEKGYVQLLIEKHIAKEFTGQFYICGLYNMIEKVVDVLEKRGVSKDRIHFERYD